MPTIEICEEGSSHEENLSIPFSPPLFEEEYLQALSPTVFNFLKQETSPSFETNFEYNHNAELVSSSASLSFGGLDQALSVAFEFSNITANEYQKFLQIYHETLR